MMASNISIEIINILNKNGTVYIGLYDKADSFKIISKNYKGVVVNVDAEVLKYRFENIPDGTYAISVQDYSLNFRYRFI